MGRIIRSKEAGEEFLAKEMNRRAFIRNAAAASAGTAGMGLAACDPNPGQGDDDDSAGGDDDDTPAPTYLVGVGAGDSFQAALEAALNETVGRNGLEFIQPGDTVFLKVNCNSGDPFPYSTSPDMVRAIGQMCWDRGASAVTVGDRSFFGDQNTLGNLQANGIAGATEDIGAELVVLDTNVDWYEFGQDIVPDWQGGFRLPAPIMDADHIITLPNVKTHFIANFTMAQKLLIGAVHPQDRARPGNLANHSTAGNLLYRQIAQINQNFTSTLVVLNAWEAVTRGGPNINNGGGVPLGEEAAPGIVIASTDAVAADAFGYAILKEFAHPNEAVHNYGVWDHPQMVEGVAAGVGVGSLAADDISGPSLSDLDTYLQHIV